jgi:hypothetical protein
VLAFTTVNVLQIALASLALLAPPSEKGRAESPSSAQREDAEHFLQAFFGELLLGDVPATAGHCGLPFQLEGRRLESQAELVKSLSVMVRERRTAPPVLQGLEVLTPSEMEAKHGKPPARLKDFPWKRSGTWLGVANLSGRAAVVALARDESGEWRVTGYSD